MASFLSYSPVSLAFGTSGLRGLVKDITDLEAYINVKGALRYLLDAGDIRAGSVVALAGDLRPSTERIMRASHRAIADAGCHTENAGKIPTPALLAHSLATGRAGVMVSGSHIPFDRNGIKLNKRAGEVLKSDEAGILVEVARVRAEEYGRDAAHSAFDATGMLKQPPELPPLDGAAEQAYVRRYTGSFGAGGLSGQRVLVYQHSAVGRDILPHILRELGAEVLTAGRSDTFIALDTENITDEQLATLRQFAAAAEKDGQPVSAIVSTDGDSDRPLVVAVDEDVRFLPGDLLGIVVAEYLRADAVAVPISANDAVERRMRERGVELSTCKIGSPYVVAALDELKRAGRHARIVGWEANGGFLTGSDIALGSGTLAALPTRDSTLPILANLFAAAEERAGLAARWSRLPSRFGRSGLIDNFPVAASRAILAKLNKATAARFFTSALGFDAVERIDTLDGVRVYFHNGDIAHVRPSGNAPQLRIYANSDSQARADQIVEMGLREPDGILRKMENELKPMPIT
jgi:phosphomannomutase